MIPKKKKLHENDLKLNKKKRDKNLLNINIADDLIDGIKITYVYKYKKKIHLRIKC